MSESESVKKILFVCHGNTCRSPAAEAIFASRSHGLGWVAQSAGTHDRQSGEAPTPTMVEVAKRHGVSIGDRNARRITENDFVNSDLIVGLDRMVLHTLNHLRPAHTDTQIVLLRDLTAYGGDVPDPYHTGAYEEAYHLISEGIDGVLDAISSDAF